MTHVRRREELGQRGIFYALAAGNDGANACNSSPARATPEPTPGF